VQALPSSQATPSSSAALTQPSTGSQATAWHASAGAQLTLSPAQTPPAQVVLLVQALESSQAVPQTTSWVAQPVASSQLATRQGSAGAGQAIGAPPTHWPCSQWVPLKQGLFVQTVPFAALLRTQPLAASH
jgi:hypothetical protein